MTIKTTLAQLKTILASVDTTESKNNKFKRIDDTPVISVKLADFPQCVLMIAPDETGTIGARGGQYQYHNYFINMIVFLGGKQTPLPELSQRAEPWPQAVADVLFGKITLNNTVKYIGDGDKIFDYQIRFIGWGSSETPEEYFGIVFKLPVFEVKSETITA